MDKADRTWINDCLGEFQIIHCANNNLEIINSELMTHPVYFREDNEIITISNRSSLTNVCHNDIELDINTQLQIIAFDSIFKDDTAFKRTKCLSRGCKLEIRFDYIPQLVISRNKSLWAIKDFEIPDINQAIEDLRELSYWLVEHLHLLTKQMRMDNGMAFNLSGGKDSRLLLVLFLKSGLMNCHEGVLTYGLDNDPEVLAAKNITSHYGLKHQITPRVVEAKNFFEKLPLHIFQMEGEINCRVLHGNYLGRRKMVFTGHEAGLRESFANTEQIKSHEDVMEFIKAKIPLDPIGFIKADAIETMRNKIIKIYEEAIEWHVKPQNFLNWFSIIGRGCRWVGKLTSMSSPCGLYANPLCSTKIVAYTHNMGVLNRRRELFHYGVIYNLDKEILKYPLANQTWHPDIKKAYPKILNGLSESIIISKSQMPAQNWWDILYNEDNRRFINNLIQEIKHPALDDYIDYNKLLYYINSTKEPSARAMLSIFSMISSNLLFHSGDITQSGVNKMRDIISQMKKKMSTNKQHIKNEGSIVKVNSNDLILNRYIVWNGKELFEFIGEDPYFEIQNISKPISKIAITANITNGEIIEIYWQEKSDAPYINEKRIRKTLECNKMVTYEFDLSSINGLSKVRIDPSNDCGLMKLEKVEIHYVTNLPVRKINVGCGPKDHKPNWINVDIQPFKGVDVVMDVTKEWDFKDVDYIFAEHFIEHLDLDKGVEFLYNAGMSLGEGGWIRISTSNVEWVLKSHYKFDSEDEKSLTDSVYAINRAFYGWQHRFLYSPFLLKRLLLEIGYVNVRETQYGESSIDVFKGIEQHGKVSSKDGLYSVIIIEAQKGGQIKWPDRFLDEAMDQFIKYSKAKG